ncbi:MAG: DUF2802 domain-containing protein [Gammaproteobacteria bacterium]|nr:DUF2802 domain-containing protein [Gammaproteobacteria bacterium]
MSTSTLMLELPIAWVAAGASAVTLVVVLAALRAQSRRIAALTAAVDTERRQRDALEQQFQALLTCSRELGDRVREQSRRERTILAQIQHTEPSADTEAAIAQAGKLMAKGMPLDEISDLCDLTQGELELLARLQRRPEAA